MIISIKITNLVIPLCILYRIEMNVLFEMCAVMLVEIPCGYTASTFTSIAMTIQEYALRITTENLVKSHYLHAVALSILSLICYIHQAEVSILFSHFKLTALYCNI